MDSVTLKTETVGLQFLNTTRYSNPKEDHRSMNNHLEDEKSYDYIQNKIGNVRIK